VEFLHQQDDIQFYKEVKPFCWTKERTVSLLETLLQRPGDQTGQHLGGCTTPGLSSAECLTQ